MANNQPTSGLFLAIALFSRPKRRVEKNSKNKKKLWLGFRNNKGWYQKKKKKRLGMGNVAQSRKILYRQIKVN